VSISRGISTTDLGLAFCSACLFDPPVCSGLSTMIPPRSLTLLAWTWLCANACAQTCYFPNGDEAPDDIPCDPSGATTVACCGRESLCTQNNLCYTAGRFGRGTCTDKSWNDGRCTGAQECNGYNPQGGVNVVFCGDPNVWTCDGGGCLASNLTVEGPWGFLIRPDESNGLDATGVFTLDVTSGLRNVPAPTECPDQATTTITLSTVRVSCHFVGTTLADIPFW
jgi:hypothetical protein